MIFRKNLSDSLRGLRIGLALWSALAAVFAIADLLQEAPPSPLFAVPVLVASGYYIAFILVEANERVAAQIVAALEREESA